MEFHYWWGTLFWIYYIIFKCIYYPGVYWKYQNCLKPKFIRDLQVFIGFANFYRRFILNLSAIAGLLTLILKTNLCFKFSKLAKKSTIKPTKQNSTLFLTKEAKESFPKLKNTFCEGIILQHVSLSQLIRLETDVSGNAIGEVLC